MRNPGGWARPEEIAFSDLTLGTVIGTGSDKTVYLGNFRSRTVAISMFREKKTAAIKVVKQSAKHSKRTTAGTTTLATSDPVGPCAAECFVYTHAHLCANIARTLDPKTNIVYMVSDLARYGALDRSPNHIWSVVANSLMMLDIAGFSANVQVN